MQRYRSRRSMRKLAKKSRRNFFFTLIISVVLIYVTITWILPYFINGVGFVKDIVSPSQTISPQKQDSAIAPPVLNIPYEATGSGQIDIKGFGTPNTKVIIYLDDEPKQTINVSQNGDFIAQNIDLTLGTNNIFGKTIDETGKESLPSKTIRLKYINGKPKLTIDEPEDNKNIQGGGEQSSSSNKKVKVAGKVDPEVKVYVSGTQVIVNNEGNFSLDIPLNEGDNIITIQAIDAAFNSTEIERKVTYTP